MCEQRPSLIVFQTIQKLVFFKLANKILFRGERPVNPLILDQRMVFDPPKNSKKWAKLMKNAFFGRV